MSVLGVHLNPEHGFSKLPQLSIKLLKGLGVEGDCHLGKTTQHLWRLKRNASEPNLRQVHLIQSELFDEPEFHGEDGARVLPGQMGENVTTVGVDLLSLGNGTKIHFVDRKHAQTAFDGRDPRVLGRDLLPVFKYLVTALFLEVVAMAVGCNFSWSRIAPALIGSLNGSLFACHVGFWPDLVLLAVLMSFGANNNLQLGARIGLNLVLSGYTWYNNHHDSSGEHAVVTVTGVRHPCKKVDKFRSGLQEKCVVRGGEKNGIVKRKAGIMAVVTRAGTVKPGMTVIAEMASRFEELPVLS